MRINDIFEANNYLGYLGPPFQTCCSCNSLKRGAQIIAYLDIAAGILYLIIWIFYMINFLQQVDVLSSLATYLLCVPGILGMLFAFSAIRSLERANFSPFYLYSKYKTLEFIIVTLMSIIRFFIKITGIGFSDVFDMAVNIIYHFFTSKLVWSTAKWLKNAEQEIQQSRSNELNSILKQNLNPDGYKDMGNSVELI
jgi:hypothetical protein